MSAGEGGRPKRPFSDGFAAIDNRLVEEVGGALTRTQILVYLAAIKLFRGRVLRVGLRPFAAWARLDHSHVVKALPVLERLHLLRVERSTRGSRIEVLEATDEALCALRERSLERGGAAAKASPQGARLAAEALERLGGGGARRPRAPRPVSPPRARGRQPAARGSEVAGDAPPAPAEGRAASVAPVEARPAPPPEAAAPRAEPPPGDPVAGRDQEPGHEPSAEAPATGGESGADAAPPSGADPSPLGEGLPNYSLDQSDKIPPSLPPPAASEAVGGEEPAVAEPPPAALAAPPAGPVAAEGPGAGPPAEGGALTTDPRGLAPLVELARPLWPRIAPPTLLGWLQRGVVLVRPAPSRAELAAYIQWAAQDESLARAKHPLAAAMTAHRLVPWLEKRRARSVPPTAARAPFRPAATRPSQLPTAEERAAHQRQCALAVEMARQAIDRLNAPMAAVGVRRRL